MKIALVTYKTKSVTARNLDEDILLLSYLINKGLDVDYVAWNAPQINWTAYDLAIIKSTWDYHIHIDAFATWLTMLAQEDVMVLNPIELIIWNSDKHYLREMLNEDFPAIPSIFLERGATPDFESLFNQLNTTRIVIKPCVSASANNTTLLTCQNYSDQKNNICQQLISQSLLVQPFMEEIKQGEWSLVFFNGRHSHSVLKVPNQGDFRVQNGTTHIKTANREIVKIADNFVQKYAPGSLYARVDGIVSGGNFMLMELELIEPSLFLNTHINSLRNYYSALKKFI